MKSVMSKGTVFRATKVWVNAEEGRVQETRIELGPAQLVSPGRKLKNEHRKSPDRHRGLKDFARAAKKGKHLVELAEAWMGNKRMRDE